jgi:hypothetical protein
MSKFKTYWLMNKGLPNDLPPKGTWRDEGDGFYFSTDGVILPSRKAFSCSYDVVSFKASYNMKFPHVYKEGKAVVIIHYGDRTGVLAQKVGLGSPHEALLETSRVAFSWKIATKLSVIFSKLFGRNHKPAVFSKEEIVLAGRLVDELLYEHNSTNPFQKKIFVAPSNLEVLVPSGVTCPLVFPDAGVAWAFLDSFKARGEFEVKRNRWGIMPIPAESSRMDSLQKAFININPDLFFLLKELHRTAIFHYQTLH